MQAKLLRVLEEGEVERVGGDKPIKVNVRVVVATHRNLEDLVKQNAFRRDLFHRVYVFPLRLPPLRERPEDFQELAAHFARQVAAQNGWKETIVAADAIVDLRKYGWPGNVRELRNVVERLHLAGGRRNYYRCGCSVDSSYFGFGGGRVRQLRCRGSNRHAGGTHGGV